MKRIVLASLFALAASTAKQNRKHFIAPQEEKREQIHKISEWTQHEFTAQAGSCDYLIYNTSACESNGAYVTGSFYIFTFGVELGRHDMGRRAMFCARVFVWENEVTPPTLSL